MLSLLALSAAADPIQWNDLGLRSYLFEIGSFQLRYYSLAYLIGVIFAYWHLSKMIKSPGAPMAQRHADDLFFYCTLGVILGGRLGYALFYQPSLFTSFAGDGFVSWELLRLWDGGMSFHGGVLGVLLAIFFVGRGGNLSFLRVCDYIAVTYPLGHLLGRLANFTNGELWGRPSDVAWAMVFPLGGEVGRHPSQLYQAGLEGLLPLIILMWMFWKTGARYRPGLLVGVFTLLMSAARFINEFFREPDQHLASRVVETGLSQGQWLTIPLFFVGLFVTLYALKRKDGAAAGKGTEAA